MVAPTATIELYVDGIRVPSTPAELDAGLVTALDNLRLTWGRDGQNEQPGPASTVFELVDPAGRDDALDLVHVGSTVAVWAEGEIPHTGGPGPSFTETVDSPGFDAYPVGPVSQTPTVSRVYDLNFSGVAGGTAAVADAAGVGHHAASHWGADIAGSWAFSTLYGPRPFSPTGELPNAWDDLPKALPGTTDKWRYRCSFKAPAGATVALGPAGFATPYSGSTTGTIADTVTATGAWQTWERVRAPSTSTGFPAGSWQGVLVRVTAPGPNIFWQDQTGTWAGLDPARTWADPRYTPALLVDDVSVAVPAAAETTRRVLVFSGAVSDLVISPRDGSAIGLAVTAMDLGADLGNRVVGDTPWAVQTVKVRANRVAELAGVPAGSTGRVLVDTPLDTLQLSARDVDAQPAYALLQDIAQSAGGVLWAATHASTGPYLWIENPASRAAVRQLVLSGGKIVIAGATRGVSTVSACDLLEEPVRWSQDNGDVVTVVAVTWAEQGVDDDGLPTATERTVTVTDQDAIDGTNGKPKLGTRRLSISTELIAEADATGYASRVLAQARAVGWRLDGLVLDTGAGLADQLDSLDDVTRQTALLDLLDGTTRMGAAVTLVDMPPYAPRGAISDVYVDGGTYTYTGDAWRLELATTPSAGQGASVTWAQLATTHPTWTWSQVDPGIAWVDLYGVTV